MGMLQRVRRNIQAERGDIYSRELICERRQLKRKHRRKCRRVTRNLIREQLQ